MSVKDPSLQDGLSLTFQTRLNTSAARDATLSAIAGLMSSIERGLYIQWRAGHSLASLKNKTIAFYQVPARYFNAVKASLDGKIRSVNSSHSQWQHDWQDARQSQFFIVGSKDESHGCQLCVLTQAKDGSLTARLRVPDALRDGGNPTKRRERDWEAGEHGQYLELTDIHFAHGGDVINAALANNQRRQSLSLKAGRDQFGDLYKHYGQALSFRFVRDKKGWRLLVTTAAVRSCPCTCPKAGAMGLDINGSFVDCH